MTRAFWITIAVVLVGFGATYWVLLRQVAAGLASTSDTSTVTNRSSTSSPYVDRLVTDTDHGSTVKLATGETLAIKLDTHSSGGYQYSLDAFDRAILRLTDHRTIEPSSTDANGWEIVGAGNLEEWTFAALQPGTTKIELTDFRSFEPRPTSPTFTLTVVVESS